MSNKSKTVSSTTSKTYKSRPSTVGAASSSRHLPSTVTKDRNARPKVNKNATFCDGDISIRSEVCLPEFDAENRQIAYGKLLRSMLEDCLLDEKIEREETQIDKDMTLLANRFQKTVSQLDKTNSRLKEISFVAERERLLEQRRQDNAHIFETTEKSDVKDILTNLSATEQANLDKLTTKNVDFGYDKNNGYKQLLDAVNDAIEGLDDIKKHSNLDMSKYKEFESSKTLLKQTELSKMDLDTLEKEYNAKFPMVSEKLLQEASEKFARMIDDDDD